MRDIGMYLGFSNNLSKCKYTLVAFLIICYSNSVYGQSLKKKDLQNYFESNVSNLESIEGIWNVTFEEYSTVNNLRSKNEVVYYIKKKEGDSEKFSVLRIGSDGEVIDVGNAFEKVAPNAYKIFNVMSGTTKLAIFKKSEKSIRLEFPTEISGWKSFCTYERIYPQPEDFK